MKYYFSDLEKQKELKKILDEWLGTPFRHHCGVKGGGTDCLHFVARVLEEMGILTWRKNMVPDYPRDWHLHNTRELLKEAIDRELKGEWKELNGFMNGDILLSHFGKAASHVGIYFDGHVYQAVERIGVIKVSVKTPLIKRQMKFMFRVGA